VKITGIKQLDELIYPFDTRWVLEFYGEPKLVLQIAHYIMAYKSIERTLYVLLNLEFGGLDTLYLIKLCRIFNCNLDNIVVSRAFKLSDTAKALEELSSTKDLLILLIFPYNYLPKNPLEYTEATRITGLILKTALFNQVILFNTVTKFGSHRPEGGSFHHHAVKVAVKLIRQGDVVIAELTKHPVKKHAVKTIHTTILEHPVKEYTKKTLLDWIHKNHPKTPYKHSTTL